MHKVSWADRVEQKPTEFTQNSLQKGCKNAEILKNSFLNYFSLLIFLKKLIRFLQCGSKRYMKNFFEIIRPFLTESYGGGGIPISLKPVQGG